MTIEYTQYRKRCFDEHGKVCIACGTEENIEAHHRDGNRANSDIDNLAPVCEWCHKSIHARDSPPVNDTVAKLRGEIVREKEIKRIGVDVTMKDYNKLAEVKGGRTWREAIKQEFGVSVDE